MTQLSKTVFAGLLFVTSFLGGQSIYDYEHSKKFADYLFKSGQYDLAIEEFERVLFLRPGDTTSQDKLIKSFRLGGDYAGGLKRLHAFYAGDVKMPSAFRKEELRLYVMSDSLTRARQSLDRLNISASGKQAYRLGLYLLGKRWEEARQLSARIDAENPLAAKFNDILSKRMEAGHKSPLLAAALSTLVPGLGKVYTKDYADAAMALLFVGANAWQAYRGFSKNGKSSVYGWVFGGLAASFYIGNIYGAGKAAKRYNKKLDDEAYQKAKYIFDTTF